MVPKIKRQPTAADFKPISCCNVVYKTISRIIANKIAKVLPQIIDKAQVTFLEDRCMVDNMFLAQQLVRIYGRKIANPHSMSMADICKAFDTLSWSFLENITHGLRFPPKFIAWIMECITSATYSISFNGSLHGFFLGKRGVKQRDPLFPYLFVMDMEYLARMIKISTVNLDFNFHPKCLKLLITHLAFADDLILFSRGDAELV